MFKIPIISVEKLKDKHYEWAENNSKEIISNLVNDTSIVPVEKAFYEALISKSELSDIFKLLIIGTPEELRNAYSDLKSNPKTTDAVLLIETCQKIKSSKSKVLNSKDIKRLNKLTNQNLKDKAEFKSYSNGLFKRIYSIFNYEKFTRASDLTNLAEINTKNWSGYQLTYHLNVRVCPYCNRNYTTTLKLNSKGKGRPQLDHFYPHSIYPFFAISLYNLIPSCNICNSSFKSNVDTLFSDPMLHPYEDEICSKVKFEAKRATEKVYSRFESVQPDDLKIQRNPNYETSDVKSINSLDRLKIEELYDLHKQEVAEAINLLSAYNLRSIEQINSLLQIDNADKNILFELKNFFVGEAPERKVLGKLMSDIIKDEFSGF